MADLTVITYRQTRAIQQRQAYSNPPPDSEPEQMSVHESLQRSGHQRSKREPEQPETSSHNYAQASLHQAKALQFGGRLGHLVAGLLSLHPFEQFGYSLLQRDLRLIAEQRAGASDVRYAVTDVALAVFACDLRIDFLAQPLGQHPHHLFDRSRLARADVDRLVICAVGFERQQVCLNDVADVNEIARLFAVFEDHRLLVVQQPRREDGADARVRIRQRLARPVDVEVT